MGQLFLYVNLDKSAALRAGETQAGHLALPVTSAMILALSQEETGALEAHVSEDGRYIVRLDVDGTSTAAIKAACARVVEYRATEAAAKAASQAADDARMAQPVADHIVLASHGSWETRGYGVAGEYASASYTRASAECVARNSVLEAARKAARIEENRIKKEAAAEQETRFVSLVSALLSDEQRERFVAGCLPVAERDAVTRESLFAAFATLPRYKNLTHDDIAHEDGCYADSSDFSVDEVELSNADLDADQFSAWKQIAALVASHENEPMIELRCHDGECTCGEKVRRYGAKVTISLALHSYSREFAL